jgi:hypothetical protein
MFKKSVSVQTTRPLSGKDVKALRRSVQLQFPDADEDEVAQLLPAKAEIALLKLSNRAACYTVNGGSPLFFDPDGRGDILAPTVYALWLCPQLLPPVFTYSEVSPKVRRRRRAHGGMRDPLKPFCAQKWHWHSAWGQRRGCVVQRRACTGLACKVSHVPVEAPAGRAVCRGSAGAGRRRPFPAGLHSGRAGGPGRLCSWGPALRANPAERVPVCRGHAGGAGPWRMHACSPCRVCAPVHVGSAAQ